MNNELLSTPEEEVEEPASANDAAVEDYFGPDVIWRSVQRSHGVAQSLQIATIVASSIAQ